MKLKIIIMIIILISLNGCFFQKKCTPKVVYKEIKIPVVQTCKIPEIDPPKLKQPLQTDNSTVLLHKMIYNYGELLKQITLYREAIKVCQ